MAGNGGKVANLLKYFSRHRFRRAAGKIAHCVAFGANQVMMIVVIDQFKISAGFLKVDFASNTFVDKSFQVAVNRYRIALAGELGRQFFNI